MSDLWIQTNRKYILYTIICLAYLSNGIDLAILGPSINDLAAIYNSTTQKVLLGFTIRSLANGLASLLVCYTFHKFNRQLQYTLSIFLYGLGTIFLPFMQNVNQYFIASIIFGAASAYIDVATNIWVFELFQNQNLDLHVQIVHFSLSLGQIIGPLILGPFLSETIFLGSLKNEHFSNNFTTNNSTSNNLIMNNLISKFMNYSENSINMLDNTEIDPKNLMTYDDMRQTSKIYITFLIGGSLFITCSLSMVFCWIINPYIPPKRTLDGKDRKLAETKITEIEESTGSIEQIETLIPNKNFYLIFIILVQCLNAVEITMEYIFNYYLSIYLSNYLNIKGKMNTNLIAVVGTAYIIGRFFNIILSALKTTVTKSIYFNIILMFSGTIMITFYINPQTSNLVNLITIALSLMGLGYSSTLPNMYIFIEKRINITTTLNSFMVATSTALFCFETYVMTNKFENDPGYFKWINLVYISVFTIFFILLNLTDFIKNRFIISSNS